MTPNTAVHIVIMGQLASVFVMMILRYLLAG